jgi:hypothetical protein
LPYFADLQRVTGRVKRKNDQQFLAAHRTRDRMRRRSGAKVILAMLEVASRTRAAAAKFSDGRGQR